MTEIVRGGFSIKAERAEEADRHLGIDLTFDADDPFVGPLAAAWAQAHDQQMTTARAKAAFDLMGDVKCHLRQALSAWQACRRVRKQDDPNGA